MPDRLAALDRRVAAARRPLRPRRRRPAQRTPVSALARRSGRMRGAVGRGAPRRAGSLCVCRSKPLDVLAQQIAAEVACSEWDEDELYALCARAWPYRDLDARANTTKSCACSPKASARAAAAAARMLHRDAVNNELRARRGRRSPRSLRGGTIPDTADYNVVLEPQAQIGRHRQRGLRGREHGRATCSSSATRPTASCAWSRPVRVEDAQGVPPSAFRSGSAKRRRAPTEALASRVAPARRSRARRLIEAGDRARRSAGSPTKSALDEARPQQIVDYFARGQGRARTACRRSDDVVFERFFDESGGMQLVIHSPYGSRINRAWGLALRKRFCRKFNFELQAAATEDAIVLSLTTHAQLSARRSGALPARQHACATCWCRRCSTRRCSLTRWRWNASIALALLRFTRRQQGAAAVAAHGGRRSDRGDLSRSARVRGEHRAAIARFPTIRWSPDHCRLPARGDGHRRPRAAAAAHEQRRSSRDRARSRRALAAGARNPGRAAVRISRRCAAGRASHASRGQPPLAGSRNARPTSARSTPRRSSVCARKPGRRRDNADELHDALTGLAC